MINLNEVLDKIRKAGSTKVRIGPMPGQSISGDKYMIEILEANWTPIIENIPKATAEDLVSKTLNKVICG